MDRLDAKDPSQNIPLLKVLNNVDRAALIDEYGYDKYASLVGFGKSFKLVGDKLCKVVGGNLREVPSVTRRAALLRETHAAGGHVGVMKLYHMTRSMFYWPNLIEDCI